MCPNLLRQNEKQLPPIKFPDGFGDRRYFQKEIHNAFPSLSNGTVRYHIMREFLTCERGERGHFCFSGPEIIHCGFVSQLSLCGALNDNARVFCSYDISEEREPGNYSLKDVGEIMAFCRQQNYALAASVRSDYVHKTVSDVRNKAATIGTTIDITNMKYSKTDFDSWSKGGWMNDQSYSFTLISLYRIAQRVANTV